MVADARRGLRREKVAAGGLEEYQHRLVFKRGRVGEVDHHLRAGQGLFEPLAGNGVDAGIGRSGDDLMAALAQNGDGLRADDDDLHVMTPEFSPATCWTFVIGPDWRRTDMASQHEPAVSFQRK